MQDAIVDTLLIIGALVINAASALYVRRALRSATSSTNQQQRERLRGDARLFLQGARRGRTVTVTTY